MANRRLIGGAGMAFVVLLLLHLVVPGLEPLSSSWWATVIPAPLLGVVDAIVETAPNWLPELVATLGATGLVLLSVVIVFLASFLEEREGAQGETALGTLADLIQAVFVIVAASVIWIRFDTVAAAAAQLWWLVIVIPFGWIAFRWLRIRRAVASADTATRNTRRALRRDVQDWSNLLTGFVVLAITFVVSFLNGLLNATGGLSEPLALFAGEFAFLSVGAIGFAQLGGTFPGSDLIPTLTASQWLGVVAIIGALAVIISENRG